MNLSNVMDIAVSGLEAQKVRMTVTASNLANMESTGADGVAYRRRDPVFRAERLEGGFAGALDRELRTVRVSRVVEDTRPPLRRYDPGHPEADAEGYRSLPRVNPVQEMTNLLSASRSFEANLLVMRNVRQIGEAALQIGR